MTRSPKLYLYDIYKAITDIERFTKGMSEEHFIASDRDYFAVLKCLEIIGEAANALSADYKEQNPHVPWQDIKDFRNILIHQYFEVDERIVWQVVISDIPLLKKSIKLLLDVID